MPTTLTFGDRTTCELDADDCTILAADDTSHPPLADPVQAVRQALTGPRGFPPLAAATVPGDHVAVAIEPGVPKMASVLRGTVAALVDAGVPPAMITIVSAETIDDRETLQQALATLGSGAVKFELHDPDDELAIAMVGVNAHGEPVRMNRTLAEADLVLPIGVASFAAGDDAPAARFACLFPRFSNRETAQRLSAAAAHLSAKERRRRAKEVDEAGWLMGVGMTLCIVPGAAGEVAAAIAGDPALVASEAADYARAIWERPVDRQADLVVATIVGDHREQTWANLGCAVAAAAAVAEPGGAIAICSELNEPPGGSLNHLLEAVDYGEVQELLRSAGDADARPAMALAQSLEQGPVYLRSRLPSEVVEALGMTPIENDDELSRLAAERAHLIVIEEAQHVVPKLSPRHLP